MRKTERNFTNKVLESKRGDVQAVKSKIKSSVMATAFLFAATIPIGLSQQEMCRLLPPSKNRLRK